MCPGANIYCVQRPRVIVCMTYLSSVRQSKSLMNDVPSSGACISSVDLRTVPVIRTASVFRLLLSSLSSLFTSRFTD
eukprot:38563-Eustigmatos_ZCMA.PRE.1